jgi:hypothetical protein
MVVRHWVGEDRKGFLKAEDVEAGGVQTVEKTVRNVCRAADIVLEDA